MPPKEPNIMDSLNARWKEESSKEDPEVLLSEALVQAYREVNALTRLPAPQKKLLLSALDTVKEESLKKLPESTKTVQYFNQIGGAKHLVLSEMLKVVADTVPSLEEFDKLLDALTYILWHVPTEYAVMRAEQRLKKR